MINILLKDKTNSDQHSEQLERYKNTAEDWCKKNNKEIPICIYLKTGNDSQASLKRVEDKGYVIFNRQDFVKLLKRFRGIKNNIFIDFRDRMIGLEKLTNSFRDIEIKDWENYQCQGFYQAIGEKVSHIGWRYKRGQGFDDFLIDRKEVKGIFIDIYIQKDKLYFKISKNKQSENKPIKNKKLEQIGEEFYNLLVEKEKKYGYNYIKSCRRNTNYGTMIFAVIEINNWCNKGIVNIEEIIEKLNQYSLILREFAEEYNQK